MRIVPNLSKSDQLLTKFFESALMADHKVFHLFFLFKFWIDFDPCTLMDYLLDQDRSKLVDRKFIKEEGNCLISHHKG